MRFRAEEPSPPSVRQGLEGAPPASGSPTTGRPGRVRRARLDAAARLLGDESAEVRRALWREFRAAGRAGRPLLQHASCSEDARVRSQARQLLEALSQEEVLRRLQRHVAREWREVGELESAFYLLGRLDRPELDARPYVKALDAMAHEVRRRTSHVKDDLRRGRVLVQYLAEELGFGGDVETYTQPDNVYLHRAIERRRGLPLTLCALYTFVASRCGLHTGIVPLPGHVMLRLYGSYNNLIVDPFHGGEARSQEDLREYLRQHGLSFDPVWMHDANPRPLFLRQVVNLQTSLLKVGRRGRAQALAPLLEQLYEGEDDPRRHTR